MLPRLGILTLGGGLQAPIPPAQCSPEGRTGWAEIPAPLCQGVGGPPRLSGGGVLEGARRLLGGPSGGQAGTRRPVLRGGWGGACARRGPGHGDGWAEISTTAPRHPFSPAFLIKYRWSQACFKSALNNSHLLIATVSANLPVSVWLTLEPIPGVGSLRLFAFHNFCSLRSSQHLGPGGHVFLCCCVWGVRRGAQMGGPGAEWGCPRCCLTVFTDRADPAASRVGRC